MEREDLVQPQRGKCLEDKAYITNKNPARAVVRGRVTYRSTAYIRVQDLSRIHRSKISCAA